MEERPVIQTHPGRQKISRCSYGTPHFTGCAVSHEKSQFPTTCQFPGRADINAIVTFRAPRCQLDREKEGNRPQGKSFGGPVAAFLPSRHFSKCKRNN